MLKVNVINVGQKLIDQETVEVYFLLHHFKAISVFANANFVLKPLFEISEHNLFVSVYVLKSN